MDIENFIVKQVKHFAKELVKEGLGTKKIRKDFSESVQKKILALQYYRCNHCNMVLDVVNFDHIDGDSANNSISNKCSRSIK